MIVLRTHKVKWHRSGIGNALCCSGSGAPAYSLPQDLREAVDTRLCPTCREWVPVKENDQ